MLPNLGPEPFKPNITTNMSEDKKNVPTSWLAERAAHYRKLQEAAINHGDYASFRQMAWAFEFVLEEWWKPVPPSPAIERENTILRDALKSALLRCKHGHDEEQDHCLCWQCEDDRKALDSQANDQAHLMPTVLGATPLFASAEDELAQYVGTPKCMDCKWKLGSDITNNCGCVRAGADFAKYNVAFNRARELQAIVKANVVMSDAPSGDASRDK